MKSVYCSKCNTPLLVKRKALKEFGMIIDIIDPHECPEVPLPLNFTKVSIPVFGKKSDQNLTRLRPSGIDTESLRDRRGVEHVKDSTAPNNLLDQFKRFHNSTPAHNLGEEPNDE